MQFYLFPAQDEINCNEVVTITEFQGSLSLSGRGKKVIHKAINI